ncbi:MAG: hypothetical protein ACLPRE_13475 [Limisphaerales bacterium]
MKPTISLPVNRQWISIVILTVSIPVYVCLCWPAIGRRGFPEIDPLWLAMRWLWIVPIVLSGLFDGGTQLRKCSIGMYSVLSAFFFGGTFVFIVPNHVSATEIFLATIFIWGPANLFIAFVVERVSQSLFRPFCIRENTNPNVAVKTRVIRQALFLSLFLHLQQVFLLHTGWSLFTWRARPHSWMQSGIGQAVRQSGYRRRSIRTPLTVRLSG